MGEKQLKVKNKLIELPEIKEDFFGQDTEKVARKLLGKILVKIEEIETLAARIVETEAYFGEDDKGSHARNGPTKRSSVMFGPPGRAYVYFCYGMHYLFNVVTENKSFAGAVLIRAAEPLSGIETMRQRRKKQEKTKLLSGPAKLTRAFDIDLDYNGQVLTKDSGLYFCEDNFKVKKITRTARIGIPLIEGDNYRFFITDSKYVSREVR